MSRPIWHMNSEEFLDIIIFGLSANSDHKQCNLRENSIS